MYQVTAKINIWRFDRTRDGRQSFAEQAASLQHQGSQRLPMRWQYCHDQVTLRQRFKIKAQRLY